MASIDRNALHEHPFAMLSGMSALREKCPLLGVKCTCRFALHMSAFDPKRTWRLHCEMPLLTKAHELASLSRRPRFPSAHKIHRDREDDRRTPLTCNVEQRGQIAELHRLGNGCQDPGSIEQFLRRLLLALCIDYLGTPSTLGFGLARNRAHHVLVEVDALDLNSGNLDAPGLGLLIEHILDVGVELVTLS